MLSLKSGEIDLEKPHLKHYKVVLLLLQISTHKQVRHHTDSIILHTLQHRSNFLHNELEMLN